MACTIALNHKIYRISKSVTFVIPFEPYTYPRSLPVPRVRQIYKNTPGGSYHHSGLSASDLSCRFIPHESTWSRVQKLSTVVWVCLGLDFSMSSCHPPPTSGRRRRAWETSLPRCCHKPLARPGTSAQEESPKSPCLTAWSSRLGIDNFSRGSRV